MNPNFLGAVLSDDDSESVSREASPCSESPRPVSLGSESPVDNSIHTASMSACNAAMRDHAKVKFIKSTQLFLCISCNASLANSTSKCISLENSGFNLSAEAQLGLNNDVHLYSINFSHEIVSGYCGNPNRSWQSRFYIQPR